MFMVGGLPKLLQALPNLQQDILEHVPPLLFVPDLAAADAIDPILVRFQDTLELCFPIHRQLFLPRFR